LSGTSVVFDHVNFTRADREVLRAIAAECGATVQIVYVTVAAEEARRRLLANRLTRVRNDVRDEGFDLVVTQFEPPDDEPDVVRHDFHPEP
jgi:predicted kinase